ncbi:MAG: FtsQ-type POTRA domain-containing protein [Clostridiales bacterium]|nr:FtsQ-type POTRA domain-containing protein [Clostridiales bacterium]
MNYSEAARRKRGKRKKKHYVLRIIVVAAVLFGLYELAMSPIFTIKQIDVAGGVRFTAAQIVELAGAHDGDNIFKISLGNVQGNLEKNPYIRSAAVKRVFPDKLSITVEERTEDALIDAGKAAPGKYVAINDDGVILRFVPANQLPQLPVIDGLTPIQPVVGKPLRVEEANMLKPALDFFGAVQKDDFFFKSLDLSGVSAQAYIFDHLVCVGDLAQIEKSVPEIRKVTADLLSKGIERGTINVSSTACSFTPEVGNQPAAATAASPPKPDAKPDAG